MGLMKLKTRLAVAFLTITIVPMMLFYLMAMVLGNYQAKSFIKEYGLTEPVDFFSGNSMQIFNRLTKRSQEDIRRTLDKNPGKYSDPDYLDSINAELKSHYAFLMVLKGDVIIYCGDDNIKEDEALCAQLPHFGAMKGDLEGGIYLDGESQHLIKQMDFTFPDGEAGTAFIISNVDDLVPEVKSMLREMLILGAMILMIAGIALTLWVYRSILSPLNKLQEATKKIRDGNLDFTLDVDADDEIGQLCQDFEEMRIRLRENADEKKQDDKENKELISNISHDLKTPLTAIITYVNLLKEEKDEEKRQDYTQVLERKSLRLKVLIEDLFEISKASSKNVTLDIMDIDVSNLFKQVKLELEDKIQGAGLELRCSYPEEKLIAPLDSQKTYRIFENLLVNIIKYSMPNTRVYIEIVREGQEAVVKMKNISAAELNFDSEEITERFVRGDSARNTEGSGLGLAIVKSFTELLGGKLKISTEADLFKVELRFRLK